MNNIYVEYDSDDKSFLLSDYKNNVNWATIIQSNGLLFSHKSLDGYNNFEYFKFKNNSNSNCLYLALLFEENDFICVYEGYYSFSYDELLNLLTKKIPPKISKICAINGIKKYGKYDFGNDIYYFGLEITKLVL